MGPEEGALPPCPPGTVRALRAHGQSEANMLQPRADLPLGQRLNKVRRFSGTDDVHSRATLSSLYTRMCCA